MTNLIFLFGISGGEILIIMLVILLLFGPSKIPEIARLMGRGINEVKKVQREINTEIQRYSAEVEKETRKIQTDINELKQEVSKATQDVTAEPGGADKKVNKEEEQRNKAYDYNYDQYGLHDDYSKAYAAGASAAGASNAADMAYNPEPVEKTSAESGEVQEVKDTAASNPANVGDGKQKPEKSKTSAQSAINPAGTKGKPVKSKATTPDKGSSAGSRGNQEKADDLGVKKREGLKKSAEASPARKSGAADRKKPVRKVDKPSDDNNLG